MSKVKIYLERSKDEVMSSATRAFFSSSNAGRSIGINNLRRQFGERKLMRGYVNRGMMFLEIKVDNRILIIREEIPSRYQRALYYNFEAA